MESETKLANLCTSLVHLRTKRINNEPKFLIEALRIPEGVRVGVPNS